MAKTPLEIKSLARKYTESAVKTLGAIMRHPDSPPAARVMAANSLLDRGWGKPDATVTIDDKRDSTDWTRAELVAFLVDARNGSSGTVEAIGRPREPDSVH